MGNLGGAGGLLSSGAAGSDESEPRSSRSAAMGQIEWAMWANEQALASGLSEWGALALWAGAAKGLVLEEQLCVLGRREQRCWAGRGSQRLQGVSC